MRQGRYLLIAISTVSCVAIGSSVLRAAIKSEEPITPLPGRPPGQDPRKVELGRLLFADPRLSRARKTSCASCHDLETNGASSSRFDAGGNGRPLRFNTPTVFNAALSFRLNWEGKTRTLRDLSLDTLRHSKLMAGGGVAVARLQADPAMAQRFRAAYGGPVSEAGIADALAAFQETLITPDAPFDRWLKGDRQALTTQQQRGYQKFKMLGCASCHQGVNVGANLYQRRGIFHPLATGGPVVLRVPSLRNVAVTPPYFHDGSARTLPEAVRTMGRAQLGLKLGAEDVDAIVAYLGALTGNYQGRRLTRRDLPGGAR